MSMTDDRVRRLEERVASLQEHLAKSIDLTERLITFLEHTSNVELGPEIHDLKHECGFLSHRVLYG